MEKIYSIDEARVDRVVRFIGNLRHTKGRWKGTPFVLLDWEQKIIRDVFGTVDQDGIRKYRTVYIEIPKKNGKALALDTPIPTPNGWKLMQNVHVGDVVFDNNGKQCTVLNETDVMHGRKCYRVKFSDGAEIVADAEHIWVTNAWVDRPNRKESTAVNSGERRYNGSIRRERTTEEIKQTLKASGNINNHSVNLCGAIEILEADLLIPPYVLGAWIGDGDSDGARITCHEDDVEIIRNIESRGIPVKLQTMSGSTGRFSMSSGSRKQEDLNNSLKVKLRTLNLLKNKHIPQEYLRASIQQRTELLRGLMDTDGYVSKAGQCEYTTISTSIRDGVVELLHSLGYKPVVKTAISKCNGKDCGYKYRIIFAAYSDNSCFSLARKAERLKEKTKNTRATVRHIVAVEETESVPVKCIEVSSAEHQYLCGTHMIPTHNSPFASALAAYLLSADGEPSPEVYSCAVDKTQAGIIYKYVFGMTNQFPALKKKLRYTDSQKLIRNNSNDGEFVSVSADVPNKHGITPSAIIFDELHAQPSREFHDVMTSGVFAAREQPLLIYITTAGNDPDRTSICWEIRQRALRVLNGESNEQDFYACIYGLGEDRDWTDQDYWKNEENWYKANPSLGQTIKIEDMRADFNKTIGNATNEELFKQFRLNIWTVQRRTTWLPLSIWDKGDIPFDIARLKGKKCYGGLDIASTMDLSSFVLLFPEAGEEGRDIVLPFYWIPEENMFERIKNDHIPYGEWVKEGLITATPGNIIDQDYIEKQILALSRQYQIEEIGYDRHDTSMLVTHLLNAGLTMVPVNQSIGQLSPAIKATEIAIMEEKLQHGGNKVLRWNFRNIVVYRDVNENIKLNKVGDAHRIDGIDALVDAEHRKLANWKTGKGVYYGGISSIEVE